MADPQETPEPGLGTGNIETLETAIAWVLAGQLERINELYEELSDRNYGRSIVKLPQAPETD